jgi:hypothetical protein
MSDASQGPGWWQASDGKWYSPELHPNHQPSPLPAPPAAPDSDPNFHAAPPPAGPGQPKKKRTGRIVAASIVAVVILIIIIASATSKKSTPTATNATTPTTAVPATPPTAPTTTVPPTTTAPPVPVVLWQSSGSGIQSGQKFTVPPGTNEWDEVWTYDCSAFGGNGNFITSVNGFGDASGTTDTGANELGPGGSGTNHYYDTGDFSIDVNSECNWTEKAVTVPG